MNTILLLLIASAIVIEAFVPKCNPFYVRWPRVRLNFKAVSEARLNLKSCQSACSLGEDPINPGKQLECAAINHQSSPDGFSHHCDVFQPHQLQNVDGYVEADDRYTFYWKYCLTSTRKCMGDYSFTYLSDRYMDSKSIVKRTTKSSLEECLSDCLDEQNFECHSVSFNRTDGGCHMSKDSQISRPESIRLNNNPNFRIDYYENNCYNLSESFKFTTECRDDGILVKVKSRTPYTGALYGLYDFFTCRIEPKEEKEFEYLFPSPMISKNCSDSIRFKGDEMNLEVVLSTDGIEPLYFITPEDLTYQAKCSIKGLKSRDSPAKPPVTHLDSRNKEMEASAHALFELLSKGNIEEDSVIPKLVTTTRVSTERQVTSSTGKPAVTSTTNTPTTITSPKSSASAKTVTTRHPKNTTSKPITTKPTKSTTLPNTTKSGQRSTIPTASTTKKSTTMSSTQKPTTTTSRSTKISIVLAKDSDGAAKAKLFTTRHPSTTKISIPTKATESTTISSTTRMTTTTNPPTTSTATTTTTTTTPSSTTTTPAIIISTTTPPISNREAVTIKQISSTTIGSPSSPTPINGVNVAGKPKIPVSFDIFHNGQPVEAVVVGTKITLSFRPHYPIPPEYISVRGCQVEPIDPKYDWEHEPLFIIRDGCPADGVGLVCPPTQSEYGAKVSVEAFRYQTTGQVQYSCLVRICPFAPCPKSNCEDVEGCDSNFMHRYRRDLSLDDIRKALEANPELASQIGISPSAFAVKRNSTDRNFSNVVQEQQRIALGGDHVVRRRLVVVNSEDQLRYYVRTGDIL